MKIAPPIGKCIQLTPTGDRFSKVELNVNFKNRGSSLPASKLPTYPNYLYPLSNFHTTSSFKLNILFIARRSVSRTYTLIL